ncbi:hypothetical protein BOX15_Mlig020208g2 [Macrostomum lignano]|uniref:BZIP domain-containing protein n=1 Tax=Macrostomum lignano TaxID=282301 RepID=A0A267GWU5_9PLAT|nr:hypothetical protein BOX15_Mlig010025g1 [Macrostomum lignano]PAA89782.1 hypothetical protein BOX15_Mlig020208g2 [Macrostomum lignano]
MLELLLQQADAGFSTAPAAPPSTVVDAADFFSSAGGVGGVGWPAELACGGAEFESGAEATDDAEFDAFIETLQLPVIEPTIALIEADASADDQQVDELLLQQLLSPEDDCLMLHLLDGAEPSTVGVETLEEDSASSSPPMSYSTTTMQSPNSPSPSTVSSRSSAASTKSSKMSKKPKSDQPVASGGGGRVQKKKEANREAAYRYRLKQRLGDSVVDQQRSELQSSVDALANRVKAAETEARFLVSMCRQIFSSRRQLSLRQQQQQLSV